MIFQEKPDNGNILTLSSVLDAAQATAWGTSAEVTMCGGGSGQLRREPLTTAPGDREPRPGREQGKGLRLGHQANGGSSPSTVCAKGLGKALVTQKVGLGATDSLPQIPGPKAPPFPLPLETSLCSIPQLLPQPVHQVCREHGGHQPTIPPQPFFSAWDIFQA